MPATRTNPATGAPRSNDATVVWCDAHGTGRLVFTQFRRRFALAERPQAATLTLFGDTRYRLRVNGMVANYGPARFAPAAPEADSVDLAPWLRVGDNEILVEVCHRGAPSYEHAASSGGFIAWGAASDVDLSTPGAWECRRATAWDQGAMAVSFAQGPLEDCDTRRLDDGTWQAPVQRDRQDAWGPFRPRSIALLGLHQTQPRRLLGIYRLAHEWRFGCRLAGPTSHRGSRQRAPYAMCIHSPSAQTLPIGLFWGPHFLNGTELACVTDPKLGNRQDAVLALRAGWNLLYGEPEVMADNWTLLFTLPQDRGLTVSAHPRLDDPELLLYGISQSETELTRRRGPVPADCAAIPDLGWSAVPRSTPEPGVAHQPGWDRPLATLPPCALDDVVLPPGDHVAVFDVGHEYLGHIQVGVDAPAGTVIDVTSCERLRPDGLLHQFAFHWQFNETDRFVANGGRQDWEGFNPRGGRYLSVTVRGASAPVRLHRVGVRETIYPSDGGGSFACSDPFLSWLWRTGAATLRACAEDVYIDCPSRERGLYTYDVMVEGRVARAMSADQRLNRRCLWLYAMNQRPDGLIQDVTPAHKPVTLGDFSLYWVQAIDHYHRVSGDGSLIDEIWPHLMRLADSPVWLADADGLLDDARIHTAHPTVTLLVGRSTGLHGSLNVLWAMTLDCLARLAATTSRSADAARLRTHADRVIAAFRRQLWVADEGCFANALVDGRPDGDHLRTTVCALAFGIADPTQADACLAYLDRRMRQAAGGKAPLGPNDAHLVLMACTRHRRPDLAERWLHLGFASNLRGDAWTLWEHVDSNTSLCHAWSAAGVWWLSEEVLGARWDPTQPAAVEVAPDSATLTWANGVVPHPAGPIAIAWELRGNDLRVSVQAPAGVAVTVRPRGRLAGYTLRT